MENLLSRTIKNTVTMALFFVVCNAYASERPLRDNTLIFTGNATRSLAEKVAQYLGAPLGAIQVGRFNDGEISIQVLDNVRGRDIFIIQSTCPTQEGSINDNLMELFLMIRTMKRASVASINVVIPYYGYARQDRKVASRVPISAADIAHMLEIAGVDRVLSVDLHCGQIQGFFYDVPVDNLYASSVFIPYFLTKNLQNPVIVSPDAGGVDRANKFAYKLAEKNILSGIAMISKQREKAGVVGSMQLIGDVQGADAIIVDDMCDTGGTLIKAAQLLKDSGARRVFAVVTHPVFSCNAVEKIGKSIIDEMIVTDTIPLRGAVPANITCISVGSLLGEAIYRIQAGESISALFATRS